MGVRPDAWEEGERPETLKSLPCRLGRTEQHSQQRGKDFR